MKNKFFGILLIAVIAITFAITNGLLALISSQSSQAQTESIAVEQIGNTISAPGAIHSQNEATLHFQTAGKLTYLPLKEGDSVYQGETIAQLDTYQLQRQLTQALNTYKSTRDSFDQTQSNAQTGVLQGSQKSNLNLYNQNTIGGGSATDNAINDAVKRIVDENQANLDNSVINVELANYALQLSTLTSPISGIITNEDVTIPGQNITAATTFSVADPTQLVFKAQVGSADIDYVSIGAKADIQLSDNKHLSGIVTKIYPQKTTLVSGQDIYTVDIQANTLQNSGRLGQKGNVLIQSNAEKAAVTVPTWTILNHNQIWVEENGKIILKTVAIGNTHADKTEILSGLNQNDKVITNPNIIAKKHYSIL